MGRVCVDECVWDECVQDECVWDECVEVESVWDECVEDDSSGEFLVAPARDRPSIRVCQ